MFQETELSTWSEHAEGFVEGRVGIGDRAQHEREHRGIEALTGNGKFFGAAGDDMDRNGRLLCGGFGESPQVWFGFDGQYAGDCGRVVDEVRAVPGTDLDHLAGESSEDRADEDDTEMPLYLLVREC